MTSKRNVWIIQTVRDVFRGTPLTDASILAAYSCWHMFASRDWTLFYLFCDAGNRRLMYSSRDPAATLKMIA